MVLGTIGYMSPEQVRGATADHRADIFALGTILYEMLAGRRAFRGESTIETMTAILRDQPDELEHSDRPLPPGLQRIVEHCLEKRPELRFQSAQDVAFALETLSSALGSRSGAQMPFPADAASPGSRAVGWKLATAVGAIAVIAIAPSAVSHWREQPATLRVTQFSLDMPPNVSITLGGSFTPWFEASPDGRYIAFRAASPGERARVWIRPLDGLPVRPLTEPENVQVMFWSPDSRSLAFAANGLLRAMNIGDGVARTVAKLPQAIAPAFPLGGAWSSEGVILLGGTGTTGSTIWRVSALGGEFTPVTRQETNGSHAFPVFLSDGRRFLFSKLGAENGLYLGTLDGPDVMRLSSDYMQPKVAAGFLLFARAQTLMAQPFDQVRGTLSSEPAVVVDDVTSNSANGRTAFSVSDRGVLVFASGTVGLSQFTWFTRAGQPDGIVAVPNSHFTVALAPDARKVVYARCEPGGRNQSLWVTDLVRSVTTRLTFGDFRDADGTWSPDMSRIVYASVRQGDKSLYEISASGGTERLLLTEEGRSISPDDWSPDGRILLYHFDGGPDLWALPLEGDRKPFLVVKSASVNVDEPAFSPDGKWIAYNSNESGRTEVYMAPFPPTGARWQVSSSGGMQPTWRRDGREMFFLTPEGTMTAVDITMGASVELGTPRPLFQTRLIPASNIDQYAVSPDGKRFLVMNPVGEETEAPPTVILDWPALLNRQ